MQGLHGSLPQFSLILKGQVESVGFRWRSVGSCAGAAFFGWIAKRLAHVPFSCYRVFNDKKGAVMRVMGIDPGLRNLGWGVIDVAGARLSHVANGICHSAPGGDSGDLAARLLSLHSQLTIVIRQYAPDAAAVENTFVNKDAVATLKLGQARGIALLVPAQYGLVVGEYAPNAVKKTVVGVGHAAKAQIDHMVRIHLPGVQIVGADAADALAIAICHAHHLQSAGRLNAALKRAAG